MQDSKWWFKSSWYFFSEVGNLK